MDLDIPVEEPVRLASQLKWPAFLIQQRVLRDGAFHPFFLNAVDWLVPLFRADYDELVRFVVRQVLPATAHYVRAVRIQNFQEIGV